MSKKNQTKTAKKKEDKGSNLIAALFFLTICALLFYWRGPSFTENISLLISGDSSKAIVEKKISQKQRQGKRNQFLYSFMHNDIIINGESRMFGPLMAIASSTNDKDQTVFTVVYNPDEPEINAPRADVWAGFIISFLLLLIGSFNGY